MPKDEGRGGTGLAILHNKAKFNFSSIAKFWLQLAHPGLLMSQ
jgi:hypothetical protein